jgi:hypothetical protein
MNIFSTRKDALRRRMGAGVVIVLFAASIGLYAQKKGSSAPAAKSSTSTAKPATTSKAPPKSGSTTSTGTKPGGNTGARAGAATAATAKATPLGLTKGANGKPTSFRGADGSEAHFAKNGSVREVRAKGMTISHGPGGSKRIAAMRSDHSGIVTNRAGHGYVQKPFLYHGRPFAARTYFYNGRPYALYYQGYYYRGLYLAGYAPYYYYGPGFYGWAYNPWYGPVPYAWGWYGNPWYGYYGYYFSPYATYPSASYWLTDYLISSNLQQAYQEQLDAQAQLTSSPTGGRVVLTPDVKAAIATEVQNQIALENAESQTVAQGGDIDMNSSGLPRILAETSPGHPHVFVVASPIMVTDASGQECGLTEGDVLRLSTPPPATATVASVQIFASKSQECASGTTVSVGLADLQEMQNNMRATIDQGLQTLQDHQGGLPTPPPSATAAPVKASFATIAPPADPNASGELQQQAQQGDAAEQSVLTQVQQAQATAPAGVNQTAQAAEAAAAGPPPEIQRGQTTVQVIAALGNPTRVVRLGIKQIYVYPDMKITFINGKVRDVQ